MYPLQIGAHGAGRCVRSCNNWRTWACSISCMLAILLMVSGKSIASGPSHKQDALSCAIMLSVGRCGLPTAARLGAQPANIVSIHYEAWQALDLSPDILPHL